MGNKIGINTLKERVEEHSRFVVDAMKIQQDKARYFVHRDMEYGKVTRDPWIEKGVRRGEIHMLKGPKMKFKLAGREIERRVCWITNSEKVK